MSDFLSGTADTVVAMLEKMETEAAAPAAAVTPEAPAPVQTQPAAVETPTTTEVPPVENEQILDVSPDTKVRIKVDGQEKVVSAKEYTELLQRNDVITQRHQALAKQRQELENHYAQKEAYIQQQAQAIQAAYQQLQAQGDPVERLVARLTDQGQAQTPKQAPTDIATIGEVQQAINAFQAQQQQELQKLYQQTQLERQQEREQAQMQAALAYDQQRITETVKNVLSTDDGKMLAEINPQAEAVIRWNALQMGPENVEQAIQYVQQYANDWASKVRGRFAQQQTVAAVKTAKTVMEPPSGNSPTLVKAPQKTALKKDGSVDWDALRARALSMMD